MKLPYPATRDPAYEPCVRRVGSFELACGAAVEGGVRRQILGHQDLVREGHVLDLQIQSLAVSAQNVVRLADFVEVVGVAPRLELAPCERQLRADNSRIGKERAVGNTIVIAVEVDVV